MYPAALPTGTILLAEPVRNFVPTGQNDARSRGAAAFVKKAPAFLTVSADAAQTGKEVHNACQHHDGNGIELRLAQQEKAQRENADHEAVYLRRHNRAPAPEGVQQNRHAGGCNHCHDRRTKRTQHTLQNRQIPVLEIELCNQCDQDTRGQNAAGCCSQRTGNARDFRADERRRIDGNRSRGHFGNRDKVCKLGHGEPAVRRDDLRFNQRHCRVAASKAEGSDLQEAQE